MGEIYSRFEDTPFYKIQTQIAAPFTPTPIDVIEKMLSLAKVKKQDRLIDLGSGDGRVPIFAALKYGCEAVGVEINHALAKKARKLVYKFGINNLVTIIEGDLFDVNLAKFTVVTVYLTPGLIDVLQHKLEKEIRNGARVVTHDYEIPKWHPIKIEKIPSSGRHIHKIFLYKVHRNINLRCDFYEKRK